METSVHKVYGWEIQFASGLVFSGMAGSTPFNPCNPPTELGQAVEARLIPRNAPHLPRIVIAIPPGGLPVINRDVSISTKQLGKGDKAVMLQSLTGMCFRVGRRQGNSCQCICIDVATGDMYKEHYTVDKKGRHKTTLHEPTRLGA